MRRLCLSVSISVLSSVLAKAIGWRFGYLRGAGLWDWPSTGRGTGRAFTGAWN